MRRIIVYGLLGATALYVLGVIMAGILVFRFGDSWWPATILLYGPRWPLVVPVFALLPIAIVMRRKGALFVLIAVALFGLGPYMGFNVPWQRLGGSTTGYNEMRIMAFNAEGMRADAKLRQFVSDAKPDVIVIPECGLARDESQMLPGFYLRHSHSVCVLSRFPILDFVVRDPGDFWERGGSGEISLAHIEGPAGAFNVLAVHLETVREGLEELAEFRSPRGLVSVTQLRRDESRLAREFAKKASAPLLVVGDFNMTTESRIYTEYWGDLQNGFSDCGWGYGRTKRTRWFGVRIDHVLMDARWRCLGAEVGSDLGSDHRPVVVSVVLKENE